MTEEYRLDRPVAVTCPDCGGALRARHDGSLLQFECHIGHVLTAEVMVEAHFTILEAKLAAAMVALNERAELCRQLEELALGGKDIAAAPPKRRRWSAPKFSSACSRANGPR